MAGLTPREERIVKLYLIEGKSFAETRRALNRPDSEGNKPTHISADRLKQLLNKVGRKAMFYSKKFVDSREGEE